MRVRSAARVTLLRAVIAAVALALAAALPVPARADTAQPSPPSAAAAAPAVNPAPSTRRLLRVDRLLQRRLSDPRIGHTFAMLVIDAETGAVLSSHAPDRPMHSASNMKIVTAATSLATMGPDRRFVTKVLRGATAHEIVLEGAGDPLLSTGNLQRMADRAARKLPRNGRVVVHVDGDLFARATWGPGWLRYAAAGVQALARRGDNSRYPARNAASVFVSRLRAHGIRASIGGHQDAPAGAAVLAASHGHTVAQAIAAMLSVSDSNVAEVLFRHVAIATGNRGSWRGGHHAVMAVLASLGISTENVVLADGSGLSRADRLTPRFLASLLRVVKIEQPERFAAMFGTRAMPIAGVSGTLTRRYGRYSTYPSRCATGRVQAKTGTLFDTIALSGVAQSADGRRIFSFIVNNRPRSYPPLSTRRALDGLAATVVGCWH